MVHHATPDTLPSPAAHETVLGTPDAQAASLGSVNPGFGNMALARLGSNVCSWGMRLVSPSLQPSQPLSLVGSIIVGVGVIGVIAGVIAGDSVPLDLL